MYHSNISKINKIQFGLLQKEDIKKDSVANISKLVAFKEDNTPVYEGLYDPRMGSVSKSDICETDGLLNNKSPGYFGHIDLHVPVYHHNHLDVITQILSVICIRCAKLQAKIDAPIDYSDIDNPFVTSEDILQMRPKHRLQYIKNMTQSKNLKCIYCKCIQPKYYKKYTSSNKDKEIGTIEAIYDTEKNSKIIYPEYAYRLFQKIDTTTCKLIGFDFKYGHPSNLIIHTIPVCPPVIRPFMQLGNGITSQDHVTIRYEEILKSNESIKNLLNGEGVKYLEKYRFFLAHDVATLFDNDPKGGLQPMPRNSNIPHQTFGQRLRGKTPKTGRIRGNLMSRRVEMSARSVITPDPMIDFDEIGIPPYIAQKITYPEKVHKNNVAFLQKCISNGKEIYPGSIGYIPKGKNHLLKPSTKITLEIGDIVYRHLCNNDYVLMNRQPTLHKKSMMGHRVKIIEGYSFRLNVNVTEPYNADFDGDEMNLHFPQSIVACNELEHLAGLKNQVMSPASNEIAIPFVQDNVLAAHLMSIQPIAFNRREAMNILARGANFYYGYSTKSSISGLKIFDYYTPDYISLNEKLNKGKLRNLLIHAYSTYGSVKCVNMAGKIQKLLTEYLLTHTYSIGPKDLLRSTSVHQKVDSIVEELMKNIREYVQTIHSGNSPSSESLFEKNVNKHLNDADSKSKNLLMKNEKSRFIPMIESKSKGKEQNIKQMKGFLGQQRINGGRTKTGYTDRTLPHFTKYNEEILTRGFVKSSFTKGLHPHEFFFHAGGGREGLIEQALQTGQTGYIQNQMIKTLEDLIVKWNHCVCDAQGNIVQFLYGDDNSSPESIVEQNIKHIFSISIEELDLSHNLLISANHWKACVESSKTQNMTLLKKYYEEFLSLRSTLIHYFKPYSEIKTFKHSVNIEHKLNNLIHKFSLQKNVCTNLDPTTIVELYNEFFKKLCLHNNNKLSSGTDLFKFIVYTFAGPKDLICKYRVTQKAFKYFLEDLEKSYKFSRIEPGEPVGIIAAQSIGEPCTQLTLNSFHFAGSGRSQGVPRLKELLYLEPKSRQLANTIIYMKKPHCYVENDAISIKNEINCIKIKDVLTKFEIYYDKTESTNTTLNQYKHLEDSTNAPGSRTSPYILLFEVRCDVKDVWLCLQNISNNYFVNPIVLNNNTIMTRIDLEKIPKKRGERNNINDNFNIHTFSNIYDQILSQIIVKGVSNIKTLSVEEITHFSYDETIHCVYPEKVYTIHALGTNLVDLFSNPGIDSNLTLSNNVLDIFDTLGIEAARHALIEELYNVLKDVGALDKRHIAILVDRMVCTGKLLPVNSRGMESHNNGPLAKASFERITHELQLAALHSETDDMNGLSSNIMVGQAPPCGTGIVQVSLDENMIASKLKNITKVDKKQKTNTMRLKKDKNVSKIHNTNKTNNFEVVFDFDM